MVDYTEKENSSNEAFKQAKLVLRSLYHHALNWSSRSVLQLGLNDNGIIAEACESYKALKPSRRSIDIDQVYGDDDFSLVILNPSELVNNIDRFQYTKKLQHISRKLALYAYGDQLAGDSIFNLAQRAGFNLILDWKPLYSENMKLASGILLEPR